MLTSRLPAALLASLCFTMALASATLGLADLASQPARSALEQWGEQLHIGSGDDWPFAYERLALAHRLNPLSADYSADLGRLLEWRAWQFVSRPDEHAALRRLADRHYLEAVAKRPSWGFAWAHVAGNRLLGGIRDRTYAEALERAATLGPWEPGVHLKVAWMGAATWDDLPEALRTQVLASVRRALAHEEHTAEILRLAMHYDWLEHVLPMLTTQRQLETLEWVRSRAAPR